MTCETVTEEEFLASIGIPLGTEVAVRAVVQGLDFHGQEVRLGVRYRGPGQSMVLYLPVSVARELAP